MGKQKQLGLLRISIVLIISLLSCKKNEVVPSLSIDDKLEEALVAASDGQGKSYYILPYSDEYSQIPQDPRNPLTKAKVELGKVLFHETALAIDPLQVEAVNTYSCASCHHAGAGFQAGARQGIGEGGLGFGLNGEGRRKSDNYFSEVVDAQTIKSPSIMNTAYQTNMLWSGMLGATGVNLGTEDIWTLNTAEDENFLGFEGIETQAIAGIDIHRLEVEGNSLLTETAYLNLFEAAFPGEDINKINAGLAMAAYERSVLANEAPFQNWLRGDINALSEDEKEGAVLFFTKAKCYECHNGPALSSMAFYALGMNNLEGSSVFGFDIHNNAKNGRGGFTGKEEDMFKFKVPQLYNLSDSPFYGHGGNFNSIKSILDYKNKAIIQNSNIDIKNLAEAFVPLNLSDDEIDKLTLFIEVSLHDGNLDRYVPESIPSNLCFPNNDSQSRIDLGCN